MGLLWRFLAWLATGCGLITYFLGWVGLAGGVTLWDIPTEFWFYDAIGAGIFGIFFLLYGAYGRPK